jgi:CRISPR-associated protein Csd2
MAARKLIIFKHESELGNAPAHRLFELVTAAKVNGDNPPRGFADYEVRIDREGLPAGVSMIERI